MNEGERLNPSQAELDEKLIGYIKRREKYRTNASLENGTDERAVFKLLSTQNRDRVRAGNEKAKYPVDESPEQHLERKQFAKMVRSMIEALPNQERQVLLLRYYDDRAPEEVGKLLDVNADTVRRIAARAIKRLRLPSCAGHIRPFVEENNATAIPEKLMIKVLDRGERVLTEVSKEYFETEVMKIFDEKITTPGKIADELGCNPLFVSYAINRIVSERARNARSGAEPAQTPNKNPDKIEP